MTLLDLKLIRPSPAADTGVAKANRKSGSARAKVPILSWPPNTKGRIITTEFLEYNHTL